MSLFSYTYSVLRYVHDTTTGEFLNVGVALFSSDAKFIGAHCRTTYTRIHKVFPSANGEGFRSLMRYVQRSFNEANDLLSSNASFSNFKSVIDVARTVLPIDDSSLQWSPAGSGRTKNVEQELERIYARMVTRNEEITAIERRDDHDVWRHFKRSLERRNVLNHLKPKKISVADDEVKFNYAFKNGIWHCLEPISFDMSTAGHMKEKAHKWLGQIASVKQASENFRVYFLVGKPEGRELSDAFENAMSILRKADDAELFLESDADQLADRLADQIERHQGLPLQ